MSTSDCNPEFEALLNYLKQNCGCDLTVYKRASLMRRFTHRMQQLEIENYGNYWQYLQAHPQECVPLLNTVLINHTGFFRDHGSWNYLANTIIPQIIASKQPDEIIRVWSAGCASGQEVYTVVMLLAETLGMEQYLQRVQIFATDVDEDALKQARHGSYSHIEIAGIPSQLLSKYFAKTQQGYVFHSKLRRSIIFARHNLAVDAPMSKIDLLVCRNVLIYFNLDIQPTILIRFHFALTGKGFLFLGNADSLSNSKQIFTCVSLKHRVFAKGQNLSLAEHLQILPQTRNHKAADPLTTRIHIWQSAFQASPFAQLSVDRNNYLLLANEQAYVLFGLNNSDLGKRLQDLEIGRVINSLAIIRPLSSNWAKLTAGSDRRPKYQKNVKWTTDHSTNYFNVHITPILNPSGILVGTNFTFIDVTRSRELEDELEQINSELAKVTQELQFTRNILSTTKAELEHSEEELETAHQEIQLLSNEN